LSGTNALSACETVLAEQHLPFAKTILRREPDGDDVVTILFAKPVRREQLATLADAMRSVEANMEGDGWQLFSYYSGFSSPSSSPKF
jgi:hypothetical protein